MAYSSIVKPGDYFNTITYTGNDTDGRTITGVGFQPDFSWVKARSSAFSHYIIDAIRYDSGASKYLKLDSSYTGGDETPSGAGWISALNSDGYVCKNGTSNTNNCNENGVTYVAWNWLGANGTASNSDGSITSTVSANTTAGFSIVSYTGNGASNDTATIGHGLGVAPNMIMVKCRNATGGWQTSSTSLGWNNVLQLNGTNAQASGTYAFGQSGVTPTSTVFTVSATSGDNHTNTNNNNYIAYCFAEKKGYSKFGSYDGNGNANGTFVYTGFKPAFVIVKVSSGGTGDWQLFDNKRIGFNGGNYRLKPSSSSAEATDSLIDFLSNGFKLRDAGGSFNASGDTYIYMAFAENPLVANSGTDGVPATAR